MQSVDSILEVGRVLERLFVVFGGIVSIVIGWHLFKIGVNSQQTATGQYKGFKVSLTKVGPGIFFSGFGCSVLGIALLSPLKIETLSSLDGPKPTQKHGITYLAESDIKDDDMIRVSNAVDSAARTTEDQRLRQAGSILDKLKVAIALNSFSSADIALYNSKKDIYRLHPEALAPSERVTVKKVMDKMEVEFDEKG